MYRRTFVKIAMVAAAFIPATTREALSQTPKGSTPAPRLDPKDPLAVTLGYVEDRTKVNKAKFPQYKPDQKCSTCQLYLGAGSSAACSVFGSKQVPAGGWCSAWVKKV
jgi:hypothetical protein